MSTTIDQKVVEMRFDNKQFESGVKTSLNSLDNLKKGLNLSDSAKGLESINNTAKKMDLSGLANGVENVRLKFSALQVIAATALANITTAAMNAGKNFVKSGWDAIVQGGIKRAMNLENANFQLMGLLKNDQEAVDAIMKNVGDSVDGTAYSLDAAANVASQFAASGMRAGDDMYSALRGVAGVAAQTNSEYSDIGRVFTTVAGNGRLMGDQLLQLSSRGLNAAATLADYFKEVRGQSDMTEETIRKMVSKGEIDFQTFAAAMDWAFGEHAKDANKTFNGAMSNIKAALARIGAEFIQPLVKTEGPLVNLFNSVRQVINAFKAEIGPFASLFVDSVTSMAHSATRWLDKLRESGKITTIMQGLFNIVKAVQNVFQTLKNIVAPIGLAFRSIFPPATAEMFLSFTEKLRSLTQGVRLSYENFQNLKRTFKGVFAAIDIVRQAFFALWKIIKPLITGLGSLLGKILGVTGGLGDWIVQLKYLIDESDFFNNVVDKVITFVGEKIEKIKELISPVVNKIKEFFASFREKIEAHGLTSVGGVLAWVKQKLEAVGEAFEKFKSKVTEVFGKIKSKVEESGLVGILKTVWEIIKNIAKEVGKLAGKGFNALFEGIKNIDTDGLQTFLNLLASGGIAAIAGTYLFNNPLLNAKKYKGPFASLEEVLRSIIGVFDGLRGCLVAYQEQIKAGTLLKIAAAIGILAASVLVLSLIDTEKLLAAIGAITALFGDLVGSMALLNNSGTGKSKGAMKLVATLIAMSLAVLILASALKKISSLGWEDMAKGIVGVTALIGLMVGATLLLSNNNKKMLKGASGLIMMALALKIMASVCKDLAGLSWEEMGKGLTGIAGLLAELAFFVKFTGNAKHVVSTGVSLLLIAAAMKILASVLKDFAVMNWEEIGRGLVAMAGALAEITIAVNLMPKNMLSVSAGLLLVSAALLIISNAMKSFASMSWEEIGRGLVVMAGALAELTIALNLMKGAVGGAAALIIASVALAIIAPVLKLLGSMSWESILKGLVALAGVFLILGVAGAVLGPLVPAIIGLSGALALLGVAVTAIGVGIFAAGLGLQMFAMALASFAVSGAAGAYVLVEVLQIIIGGLVEFIPQIMQKLAEGLVLLIQTLLNTLVRMAPSINSTILGIITGLLQTLADNLPQILESVTTIISGVLEMIVELAPQIMETIGVLLLGLLELIGEYTPQIVETALGILTSILEGIAEHMDEIVQAATDIVVNFLEAIGEKLPDVVQAGWDLLINFIDGMTQSIEENTPRLVESMQGLVLALLDAALEVLEGGVDLLGMMGEHIMQSGLIKGISEKIHALKEKIREIVEAIKQKIKEKLEDFKAKGKEIIDKIKEGFQAKIESIKLKIKTVINGVKNAIREKFEEMKTKGKELIDKIKEGFTAKISEAKQAIKDVIDGVLEKIGSFVEDFLQAGKDLVQGLIDGIFKKKSDAVGAAANVAQASLDSAKRTTEQNSPSKAMMRIGEGLGEGFVIGIMNYKNKVANAGSEISKEAMDAFQSNIINLSDIVAANIDTDPVIKPVLDLSNLEQGTRRINAMFSQNQAMSVGSIGGVFDAMSMGSNGNTYNFTQNNYSPKALSRIDIYRQTKNQFSTFRRANVS